VKGRSEDAKGFVQEEFGRILKRQRMTMEKLRESMVAAILVVVAFLGLACSSTSSNNVGIHGIVKPPQEVLKRIEETRNAMSCVANVFPTIGK
jgi:hypothetical protein